MKFMKSTKQPFRFVKAPPQFHPVCRVAVRRIMEKPECAEELVGGRKERMVCLV